MAEHYFRLAKDGPVHVVELALPIQVDPTDFDKLNESITEAADGASNERWVLDMRQVEYVGSALLGLLVNLRQRIKTGGGRLVLCGLSEHVSKALETCSLHHLFTVTPGREEAVKKAQALK